MSVPTASRGRPRRAAVDEAALRETLRLLHLGGYPKLRMRDVAAGAGIGLGALYRRWPSKHELVVDALRAAAKENQIPPSEDPTEDLVQGLLRFAAGLHRGTGALLANLLAEPESELSHAIVEAKVQPFLTEHVERLKRVIGEVPDLALRADLGPALVVYRTMARGRPPADDEIRHQVVPAMLRPGDART